MHVRAGIALVTACLLLVSCSDDDDAPSATADAITSSSLMPAPRATTGPTTVPITTAVRPATTSSTTTSSTPTTTSTTSTSTTTTTTVAPPPALALRDDGIGEARFGTDPDSVIDYVSSILGAPTVDSGWGPAAGVYGSCPGREVRGVSWRDLMLLFGDASTVTSGRRHLFAYVYGPPFGTTIDPAGLQTPIGLGVGSTVAQLRAAYPAAELHEGDQITPPGFTLGDSFSGILTGTSDADTVRSVAGGVGCGE